MTDEPDPQRDLLYEVNIDFTVHHVIARNSRIEDGCLIIGVFEGDEWKETVVFPLAAISHYRVLNVETVAS